MNIGFTGTREGMSARQKALLVAMLAELEPEEFHHGDCIGADEQAHNVVREHWPKCIIISHPPISPRFRAYCKADAELLPLPYLDRNRAIVACCEELIAAPFQTVEPLAHGGTWYTINYARQMARKPVHMLMR